MEFEQLEEKIGYTFKNRELLREALTHSTYLNENRELDLDDNQRLEFLGDTVVNATITMRLFVAFPDEREGMLTKMRAELISEGTLSRIAVSINLGDYLCLGKGELLDGGNTKPSLLSDAYEAVVGAIFMDSSFDNARNIIEMHFERALGPLEEISITDYKSMLLEICQTNYHCLPELVTDQEKGPEHDKTFVVNVVINGEVVGSGEGRSKKRASQNACKESLKSLGYLQ